MIDVDQLTIARSSWRVSASDEKFAIRTQPRYLRSPWVQDEVFDVQTSHDPGKLHELLSESCGF